MESRYETQRQNPGMILALGELLIDLIPGRDGMRMEDEGPVIKTASGSAGIFACAAALLGGNSGFIGKVGRDSLSRMATHTLHQQGVDISHLVQAEETLRGIILQLDEAMRRQFQEKFAQIAEEFDKVFRELFGGGKGTLELLEDEDILEAGIRIIAQPPGKKLQNMMQLSGGEKALTAIALLFAIQNLKPSPFCLLDEIEAALDDSNVGRFAGYLHKLTKHTQFIVITHRRGTMEKADRLYGITMQEKGVSTLVSVSLIDKELTN